MSASNVAESREKVNPHEIIRYGENRMDEPPDGFVRAGWTWLAPFACPTCGTRVNWRMGRLWPCHCATVADRRCEITDVGPRRRTPPLPPPPGWLASGDGGDPDKLWARCPECMGLCHRPKGDKGFTCTGKIAPDCGGGR